VSFVEQWLCVSQRQVDGSNAYQPTGPYSSASPYKGKVQSEMSRCGSYAPDKGGEEGGAFQAFPVVPKQGKARVTRAAAAERFKRGRRGKWELCSAHQGGRGALPPARRRSECSKSVALQSASMPRPAAQYVTSLKGEKRGNAE